ncbi:unnamed protein product, partial [Vitis vinifera]
MTKNNNWEKRIREQGQKNTQSTQVMGRGLWEPNSQPHSMPMEAASASSPSPAVSSPTASDPKLHFLMQIRSHETAIGELSNLPTSRNVYQKNGNLFFRTTIQKATASEQKQLNSAKAKLQKLNSP